FFFQAEDGIRDDLVTGVQTCALPILEEIDAPLEAKLAAYLRARQAAHGGWPLYHGGDFDMSCSVKAYFALKLAGDSPLAPHMVRSEERRVGKGCCARGHAEW